MKEDWAQVLSAGLKANVIPVRHLMVLSQYMDPPEPDPSDADFEIRDCGAFRAYFCRGRRMFHRELLGKRFDRNEPLNSYAWLRRYRAQVDDLIDGASPRVREKVFDIYMQLEEAYSNVSFPAKPLYEAFCLGRVLAYLEDDSENPNRPDGKSPSPV